MSSEDIKQFLSSVLAFLKYWLWDSWHGESTAETQTRRIFNPFAPVFRFYGVSVPVWLVFLAALIVIVLVVKPFNIGFITYEIMTVNVSLQKLTPVNACIARGISSGRTYIAYDCPYFYQVGAIVMAIISIAAVFILGFFSGMKYEALKKK